MNVPFNQPYLSPLTLKGADALRTLGKNYDLCKKEIKKHTGFNHIILTPSCTSALELAALALNIGPGDEVILPSYTYVSTANAFALRGAKLIFVDTCRDHPTIDLNLVEKSITSKTKAIVIVHYGGVAPNYGELKKWRKKFRIPLIEDAAHCFGSRSGKDPIGSIGDFATFSFHETKNISCGQGGALIVNNLKFWQDTNVIAYCGTDKLAFIEKKIKSYGWKTTGSNYLLAEPLCSILLASLKQSQRIMKKRVGICKKYQEAFKDLKMECMLNSAEGNGHVFYLVTKNKNQRDTLIRYLKAQKIETTFHYSPLHQTRFAQKNYGRKHLPNTEKFGNCLVRLPVFYEMTVAQQQHVITQVRNFFSGNRG